MNRLTHVITGSLAFLAASAVSAADGGGWHTQDIDLEVGWNLVWLEVEPASDLNHPSVVFPDAESVFMFVPGRSLGDRGAWRSFHRDHPDFVSSLNQVQGDRGYFVLSDTAVEVSITGRPLRRNRPVSAEAPALLGVSSESGMPPTFEDFFAIGQAIEHITAIHAHDTGADDFTTLSPFWTIDEDAAYWITTDARMDYAGPIRLKTGASGVQFGKNKYAADLQIEVPRDPESDPMDRQLTVELLDSAMPPTGEAGDVSGGMLDWVQYRDAGGVWQAFDGPLDITVPSGEISANIFLRADRKGRAPACVDLDGSMYQALLSVTDEAGNRELVGVGMEILESTVGTWMGDVTLDTVVLNSLLPDPSKDMHAAEPMRFGILLEIAADGTTQILDQVCIPVDATYAKDGSVISYDGFRSFRSILFPEIVTLIEGKNETFSGSTMLAADHPLNPYRHQFNPEHVQGYAITRAIDIAIKAFDPAAENEFLGDILRDRTGNNQLVGTYSEVITGLSAETITVSGSFRVIRLSDQVGLRDCPE